MTRFKKCQFPWQDCDTTIKPPYNIARITQAGFGAEHRGCKNCGHIMRNTYKICDFHYMELKEEAYEFEQKFSNVVNDMTGRSSTFIAFKDDKQIIHKATHANDIVLSSQRLDKHG
jgi:hypothetical protein